MTRLDTPFDSDTDLDALLSPEPWERALLHPPKAAPVPRADLEAVAQQVARQLGKAIPAKGSAADTLGRHPHRGGRGPWRGGPRGGWRGRGAWLGPWVNEEIVIDVPEDVVDDLEGVPAVWSGRVVSAGGRRYRMRTRLRGTARATLLPDGRVALLDADGLVRRTERPLARLRSLSAAFGEDSEAKTWVLRTMELTKDGALPAPKTWTEGLSGGALALGTKVTRWVVDHVVTPVKEGQWDSLVLAGAVAHKGAIEAEMEKATPADRSQVSEAIERVLKLDGSPNRPLHRNVFPGVWSGYVFRGDNGSTPAIRMSYGIKGTTRARLEKDGRVRIFDGAGKALSLHTPAAGPWFATGSANTDPLPSEPKGLLDVFDPRHNLREIAKEMLLLEDHLAQPAKHCPDCIRKHLLKGEALAEEAVQLDRDGSQNARLSPLPGQIRNLQRAFLKGNDRQGLQQSVRTLRKQLSKESFDALTFKPSGSKAEREPVTFALERARDAKRVGSTQVDDLGAESSPFAPLPSTVVAALRRRVAAGLEGNPAPILYRERVGKDGVTVAAGLATGTRGEGTLIVQTREATPRTIFLPISDAVLDLSRDATFKNLPWPVSIPITRADGTIETFAITPGTRAWQNIRVIASVLWPTVDSFALRYGGTAEGGREAILQRLLVAAVVNAIYESGLDANVEGDRGRAVGLFQLRDDGAGQGMSKADRKDPFLNTGRIAQRFLEVKKFFGPLGEAERSRTRSTSPASWTAMFARAVEAPSDKDHAERVRGDSAAAGFVRDLPPQEAPRPAPVASVAKDAPMWPWVLGGIAATTAAVGMGLKWAEQRS